jgi:uncharacterized protein (DUF305 family)
MKNLSIVLGLAATGLLAFGTAARAEGDLPAICTESAHHQMGPMDAMPAMPGMDQAHQDLMAGMDAMHADMMQGMMAADLDVAFVCGMIPHHQGAIDMAKAELAHGDDPWVRALAEQIIAAQEKEIADMKAWLAKQPQ